MNGKVGTIANQIIRCLFIQRRNGPTRRQELDLKYIYFCLRPMDWALFWTFHLIHFNLSLSHPLFFSVCLFVHKMHVYPSVFCLSLYLPVGISMCWELVLVRLALLIKISYLSVKLLVQTFLKNWLFLASFTYFCHINTFDRKYK